MKKLVEKIIGGITILIIILAFIAWNYYGPDWDISKLWHPLTTLFEWLLSR